MNALPEGTRLTTENFIHTTPGSILTNGSSKFLVLGHGYCARVGDSRTFPLHSIVDGSRVEKVGDWAPEPENLTTFKQRVRTVCFGTAIENGVSHQPVLDALDRLGANEVTPPLGVGMFLHLSDSDLRNRIAERTGVKYGFGDPNRWEGYAEVNIITDRAVMGGVRRPTRTVRVLAMDNPDTDVYLTPATEADAERIARLRERLWTIGKRAKSDQGWCQVYETAVGVLGVSPAVVATVADTPAPTPDGCPTIEAGDNCSTYPVGAVFEYRPFSPDYRPNYGVDNWNWTRRVNGFTHFTQNYIGPNGGHVGGRRRVLWDGRGEMFIAIVPALMQHLPVGTVLSWRGNTTPYTKRHNGEWVTDGGAVARDNDFFSNAQVRDNEPSSAWHIVGLPDTV